MPIVSVFFGIIVRMYFDDHLPPHFHAEHHGQEALLDFNGNVIEGEISSRVARRLLREWAKLHRFKLEATGSEQEAPSIRKHRSAGVEMKKAIIRVVSAEYVREYQLKVRFSDGIEKVIDFSRWLHGEVFRPLTNKRQFKRFFVGGGTVCWPNGADIAPETLRATEDARTAA